MRRPEPGSAPCPSIRSCSGRQVRRTSRSPPRNSACKMCRGLPRLSAPMVCLLRALLDRADVGRSTFYMHFQDKDELLFSGFQYLQSLLESVQKAPPEVPGKSYERVIRFSLPMFEHAQEYRRVNRALLGSSAEAVVRRCIHSVLATIVSRELTHELQNRKRSNAPVPPELLIQFLVSTFVSVLSWWLNSKNPVPPRDIDAAYRHLVVPCLASIFG